MTISSRIPCEQVVRLGPDGSVIGITTDVPAAGAAHSDAVQRTAGRPAFVYLNAGVLHRVGPHRLHVKLARQLAAAGFPGLRLDLSGIGDSANVPGDLTFRQSAVADTKVAMDHMSTGGTASRFAIFGLCSGADNALATALQDVRVAGLVLVDPPAYATRQSQLRKLSGRMATPTGLASSLARRLLSPLRRLAASDEGGEPADGGGRKLPTEAEFGAQLTTLADRGVQVLCIYSGANGERYNAPEQLFESFPRLQGRIQVAFFPTANHVFTELARQQELITLVVRWAERRLAE